MILNLFLGLVSFLLGLYELLVLAWAIIHWFVHVSNQWTELVNRLTEPVLTPIRGFLNAKLPAKVQIIDWSPVAVWIIIGLVQRIISLLRF